MKKIFLSLFVFFVFFTSAVQAGEIVLSGPQGAVNKVCQEVHLVFPDAQLTQIVIREGKTSLQFKKNYITERVITVSDEALASSGRAISDEALALIQAWQNLTPTQEYRVGCHDKPWPRYSAGSQVWAKAPLGNRVFEITDKGDGLAKVKSVVCGLETCVAYFCSPHRVSMNTALANLPAGAIRIIGEEDGSYTPVTTVGLYVESR